MKGLIIKRGNEVCKAGIPDNGVSLMVNITRYEGAYWNVGGLKGLEMFMLHGMEVRLK